MNWGVLAVFAVLAALVVLVVWAGTRAIAALVDVVEWFAFQLRNPSRESVLSFLKGVLWFLGILAYGWGATRLSLFVAENYQIYSALASMLGYWAYLFVLGGSWVGLLAVPAWQVNMRGHKTAGRMLTAMAGIAVVLSVWFWIRNTRVY